MLMAASDLWALLDEERRVRDESSMAEVERRILEGQNQVELPYGINQRTVYTVPGWRSRPRDRMRIEIARFQYRARGVRTWWRTRQQRWGG